MAGRERMRLTDRAIARLRPREREYTVWDSLVVGLGVRVRPSGGRSYVLLEDAGGRTRRVSLGPVSLKSVAEARRECHARKASPEPQATGTPRRAAPLFRDFVEGAWKEAHFGGYKPSTKKGVRSALDLLTQIINFAIARGHLETNPARDVKRNPRRVLTRFLSREEVARLHRVLDRQTRDSRREQADIIRLLLLTVNGGGIMLHAERPDGLVAAAQKCAIHGPLSVATRGGGCTAWSSMRRFDWRLSTRG